MNRLALVLEYALGHATHADNLKRAVANGDAGTLAAPPFYVDVPFDKAWGAWSRLPPFRSNWTLRSSLAARLALRRAGREAFGAALFHTQVTAQLSHDFMARVPSVISLDATPLQMDALGKWYDHAAGSAPVEGLKHRWTRRTLHAAQHLVTWSQWAKDSLIADYGVAENAVSVIPPGIDLDRWDVPKPAKRAGDPLDVLFVGGDFLRKGGDTLLAAWRDIPVDLRNTAHLHLVTKTPIPSDREHGITVYTDMVPNDARLRELFARTDLFVFPTRADCLPLAVMESLASGLPVITTSVGALPEAVTHGENGLIVPVGDAPALGAALIELLTDDKRRAAFGCAAKNRARERFDARVNYRALLETVQRVAR